ncbi:uroporphyrinogen-III synthase [soil metagenome]
MKKILVVREFDKFSKILTENGFEIINLPLIETKPLEDLQEFEAKLKNITNCDGIFLTSKNAARILADKLREQNINYGGKVYVLGKSGFEILKDANLDLVFDETANTAEEMLEDIKPEELKDKRLLFVRGEKSLRVVPEFLADFANVDEVIVYKTRKIAVEIDKLNAIRKQFEKHKISAACFFSPSGAESFLEQFGAEILHQTIIAAIGKTTAEFFERRNLKVDFVSSKATAEDFAVELIDYLQNGKRKMENGK